MSLELANQAQTQTENFGQNTGPEASAVRPSIRDENKNLGPIDAEKLKAQIPEGMSESEIREKIKELKTEIHGKGQVTSFEGKQLSKTEIVRKAKELLEKPRSTIEVPKDLFFGLNENLNAKQIEGIKQAYLSRRTAVLEALTKGKTLVINTDADGTILYKNSVKVNNTRSISSIKDAHRLRTIALALGRLGGRLEINTARPGIVCGPSIVSPEGFGGHRKVEEISGILEELGIFDLTDPENQEILSTLVINGLNGGVRHKPGQPLDIQPGALRFAKLVKFMNGLSIPGYPKGFLGSIEEIVADVNPQTGKPDHPLRILEYKAIPKYFLDVEGAKFEDYVKIITLYQESKKKNWTSAKFLKELYASGAKLGDIHQKLIEKYEESPGNNLIERLINTVRLGELACVTPHAIDSRNVLRDDLKAKIYQVFLDHIRSDEVKAWLETNYGIPRSEDPITINNKSIKHLRTITEETIHSLVPDLKNAPDPERPKNMVANLSDNMEPYLEGMGPGKKSAALAALKEAIEKNLFYMACGDSPGTDKYLCAQSLINGGIAVVVKGLMEDQDIGEAMVFLLSEQANKGHEKWEFEKLPENFYKNKLTGEIKHQSDWAKRIIESHKDKIFRSENIHLNNAINALVLAELFPDLNLNPDAGAAWISEMRKHSYKRTDLTPIVTELEEALHDQNKFIEPKKLFFDRLPKILQKIPILSQLVKQVTDPNNQAGLFKWLLGITSWAMMGGSTVGALAKISNQEGLLDASKKLVRGAYGLNTIASGVGRGLTKSIRSPLQFIGEIIGFASSTFKMESTVGQTLRSLSNLLLSARATDLMTTIEPLNRDRHKKDKETQAEVNRIFGKDKEEFLDIRKVAGKHTRDRFETIESMNSYIGWIPYFGPIISETIADLKLSWGMFKEFLAVKALRHGWFKNFFTATGISKISRSSGKEYKGPHSPAHVYNFTGILTLATGLASSTLGWLLKNPKLDRIITDFSLMIPGFGIVAAARLLEQDQAGAARQYTDINGKEQKNTPEWAGVLQRISGMMMTGFAPFMAFFPTLGSLGYNFATGLYLLGIRHELPHALDDDAINKSRMYAGKGYKHPKLSRDKIASLRELSATK